MPEPHEWKAVHFYECVTDWAAGRDIDPDLLDCLADWLPEFEKNPHKGAMPEDGGGGDTFVIQIPPRYTRGQTLVCLFGMDDEAWILDCKRIESKDDVPRPNH